MDLETIKKINQYDEAINIYYEFYKVSFSHIKLNTNMNKYTFIAEHFIILNKEIFDLFAKNPNYYNKDTHNYFYQNNLIFLLSERYNNKNNILIYNINNKDELELKYILNFYNENDKEHCVKLIKEIGYEQYKNLILLEESDIVVPIFNRNQNQIGNSYKYDSSIQDYTNYNVNFEIRKIFLLYLNYLKLEKKISMNNNKFQQFYAVNYEWVKKYKDYYDYEKLSSEIDKNTFIQDFLKNSLKNMVNSFFNLTDELIFLMIKKLSKDIIKDFNERDNKFINNFKTEEIRHPKSDKMIYDNKQYFSYFINFELISIEIFDYLFNSINNENNNQNQLEKMECIVDNDYIIVKFLNPNTEGKYVTEIGKLNKGIIFEPEYLLVYNSYNYQCEHVNNILNAGGFSLYCEIFKSLSLNNLEITGIDNIVYGIALKNNKNLNFKENKPNHISSEQNNQNNQPLQQLQNINTIVGKIPDIINKDSFNNNYLALKDKFLFPPRVGLNNIGATCYMNSTLQCFCQIEEFALYFKYDKHVIEIKDNYFKEKRDCLTSSFKILIEEIWPDKAMKEESTNRHYSPKEFRKKIADMNPLFENNQANDAKDLVNFIIMTLHGELNQAIVNNNIIENSIKLNSNDCEELYKVFYEEYQRSFRSKISELFYAIQLTKTQCLNCNNIQYNYQAYFFLVFPLEEVRKYVINLLISNNLNMQLINNNNNFNINMMNNNMNNQIMQNNIDNCNINNNMFNNMNFNGMNNNFMMNGLNNNMNMAMNFGMFNAMANFNLMANNMVNNNAFLPINNNFNFFPSMPQMQNQNPFNNINNNTNNNNNNNVANQNGSNNNQVQLNKLNNNIVTIFDCFKYNQKTDHFKGDNQIYCNFCHQMSDAGYTSYLKTAPNILIILLNRGVGIQFKIKLEFTTDLDITDYVIEKKENERIKYKLIGVITHLGESGDSGHFIAHCKSPIDGEWYTYNDAIVSKTDDFQKKIIDFGMPYLLFYQKN